MPEPNVIARSGQTWIVTATLLLIAARAFGSPDPTIAFGDFVAASDLIMVADVKSTATGGGSPVVVTAATVEVLKGVASKKLAVSWPDAEEPRSDVRGRYVLFLKKSSDGAYAPAWAGSSFWKVLPKAGLSVGCNIAVENTWRIDQIRGVDKAKIDVIRSSAAKSKKLRTLICVDKLRADMT